MAIQPTKVLLVEDSEIAQRLVRLTLQTVPWCTDLSIASNGQMALDLYLERRRQQDPYGLILMDIGLPDMPGTEVTQRIRRLEKPNERTAIIATTTYCDDSAQKELISSGINGLIPKPCAINMSTAIMATAILMGGNHDPEQYFIDETYIHRISGSNCLSIPLRYPIAQAQAQVLQHT